MANAVTEHGDLVLGGFTDQGVRVFGTTILEDGTLIPGRALVTYDAALTLPTTAAVSNEASTQQTYDEALIFRAFGDSSPASSTQPLLAASFEVSARFLASELSAPAAIASLSYSVLEPMTGVGAVVAPPIVGVTYSVLTPTAEAAPIVVTPPIVTLTMEIAAGVSGEGGGFTVSQDALPQIRVLRVVSRYAFAILSVEDGLED
jgi:hypothetical protein